jgi:hypothetical protein
MRKPHLALLPLALCSAGCVSDESLRRVVLAPERAVVPCRSVHEQLEGRGADLPKAEDDLRRHAARAGANYVVVPDGAKQGWDPVQAKMVPWTFGGVVVIYGDAFACPAAAGGTTTAVNP